jgi:signal transduction histidine kinase
LSEDVHRLAYRLHPAILEELGLAAALQAECDNFFNRKGVRPNMKTHAMPADIPHEIALALFRIAQEALRNAAQHGRAKNIEVSLRAMDDGLQLAISDDGTGFYAEKMRGPFSLGLLSMQERASLVGGELDIESEPGRGTTVVAWVPLNEKAKESVQS